MTKLHYRVTLWASCLLLMLGTASQAQINLTAAGSVYTQNFDAATDFTSVQWTSFDVNADAAACTAAGSGKWDISGPPCQLATNAARGGTGKAAFYGFSTPNAANDWIFTPSFSLAANKPYKFIYYYRNSGANYPEKMKAMVTSGSTPTTAIGGVPASAPVKDYPNIASTAYLKDSIMFTPTAAGTFYIAFKAESVADRFFIGIDDFSAQNLDVPANDVAVTAITTTTTVASCASFTATSTFTIKVKNNGSANQTNVNVAWTIKRAGTPVVDIAGATQVVATLNAGAETTFDVIGNLTTGGSYTVTATTQLPGDAIPTNDLATLVRFNPLSDLSVQGSTYAQAFASLGGVGWVANPVATATSGWQLINLGTPANPALFCRRNATAANNDWIFSNCFNFTSGQTYRITYQRAKLNNSAATPTTDEKFKLFVSTTGATVAGMTTQLGATGDEILTSATFATITINYIATATGTHYFGFQQTSDATPTGYPAASFAGTVIDNFRIITVPNVDLGFVSVSPLNAAIDQCSGYTASVPITIKVVNAGTQAIDTQNFVFKYRVKNSAGIIIQAEATLASGTLAVAAGAEGDLVATANVDMILPRFYQVEVYINNTDGNRLNDTLRVGYRNGSRDLTANNASYTENFDSPGFADQAFTFVDVLNTAGSGDFNYNSSVGFAASGTGFMAGFSGVDATNAWASTGCLKLKAGQTYAIDFKYRTTAFTEKLKVVILNAALPTTAGTAVPAGSIVSTIKDFPALSSIATYVSTGLNTFTVPTDGNYYIAFNLYSNANPAAGTTSSFALIDDIAITVPQPPVAPTGLTATASTSIKQIALAWTASAGASGYNVERGPSAAGPFVQIGTTTTAVTYNDADAALVVNTPYSYQVKAYSLPALVSVASNVATATIVASTPSVPANLVATPSSSPLQISLAWTASTNASGYIVERGAAVGGPFTSIGTPTTNSFVDNAVFINTTYFYQVKATNGFSLTSGAATISSIVTVTAPTTPTGLIVTNAATGLQNTLNWTASIGLGTISYRIERSPTSTGTFTQIGTSSTTTYINNTGLVYLTDYCYRVIAVNNFNLLSAASTVVCRMVTAIERNTLSESIKVYPNPARGAKFQVEMPEVQSRLVTFSILNTMGKEVYKTTGINEQSFEIKATGLAKGVYILHINTSKGQAVKKIVID